MRQAGGGLTSKVELFHELKRSEATLLDALDALKLRPDIDQQRLAIGRTALDKALLRIAQNFFRAPGAETLQ